MSGNGIRAWPRPWSAPATPRDGVVAGRHRRRPARRSEVVERVRSGRAPHAGGDGGPDLGEPLAEWESDGDPAGGRRSTSATRTSCCHVADPDAPPDLDGARRARSTRSTPGGINVEFGRPGRRPAPSTMTVYERGVGPTEACGTGAVAAAVAAAPLGPRPETGHRPQARRRGHGRARRAGAPDGARSRPVAVVVLATVTGRATCHDLGRQRDFGRRPVWARIVVPWRSSSGPSGRRSSSSASPSPPDDRRGHRASASTSWRCWSTPPAPTSSAASSSAASAPDPATYIGKGKAEELKELSRSRSTATPWCSTTSSARPSSATSRRCSGAPPSTAPR